MAERGYTGQNERRRNRRIAPKGSVLVRAGTYLLRGRIANLSLGGLSATTVVTAPERLLASSIEIELRFDGSDRAWCELSSSPAAISDELRQFVDREHPHARVLAIGHETVGPDGSVHWLSSADPASDLVARIRQLLVATTR